VVFNSSEGSRSFLHRFSVSDSLHSASLTSYLLPPPLLTFPLSSHNTTSSFCNSGFYIDSSIFYRPILNQTWFITGAMAPSPPTLSSGEDNPADRLWTFQLRKENAALLKLLEECKRQQQIIDAENKRKIKEGEERLAALEAKEVEYERQKQRELEALIKDREEVASMKAQIESFLRQQRVSDGLLITFFVCSKSLT
jgi:hypothetical protein